MIRKLMFITFICVFKITFVLVNQKFKRNQTIIGFSMYLCLKYWVYLIGWLLKFILFPYIHFYF